MCPSKLFIFDEFGGISTQLSAMLNTRTRCADSVVRGYQVHMDKWDPAIGDKFNTEIEVSNRHDRYAVAVKVNQDIVGHVPREISKVLFYFIKNGGMVDGEVRGKRQRSCVLEKGLEIPCVYRFSSSATQLLTKLTRLLRKECVTTY